MPKIEIFSELRQLYVLKQPLEITEERFGNIYDTEVENTKKTDVFYVND